MRFLEWRNPKGEWLPCIGDLMRTEKEDARYGTCIRSGLYLVRVVERGGGMGPILMVYRSRVRPLPMKHWARRIDILDLDFFEWGSDPRERLWRKL